MIEFKSPCSNDSLFFLHNIKYCLVYVSCKLEVIITNHIILMHSIVLIELIDILKKYI